MSYEDIEFELSGVAGFTAEELHGVIERVESTGKEYEVMIVPEVFSDGELTYRAEIEYFD